MSGGRSLPYAQGPPGMEVLPDTGSGSLAIRPQVRGSIHPEDRVEHMRTPDPSPSTGARDRDRGEFGRSRELALASPAAPLTDAPHATRRSPGRTTLVVDIDETLCVTDYNSVLWGIGRDDSAPLAESKQTLIALARDYELVYLTARPRSCQSKTQQWLRSRGFPTARLVTSPTLGDFIGQTGFKKNTLARMHREHDHMLIGIGDKPTDAEAYRENGMLPVVVNPWSDRTYRRGEVILRDWKALAAFFRVNHDLLSDPSRLSEGLRKRSLNLQLPG